MSENQGFPPEMAKLIEMLRTEPHLPEWSNTEEWAEVYFNFTVGPEPLWEVEWTGWNLPGNPNVCRTAPSLAEACQKCIDVIEASRV